LPTNWLNETGGSKSTFRPRLPGSSPALKIEIQDCHNSVTVGYRKAGKGGKTVNI